MFFGVIITGCNVTSNDANVTGESDFRALGATVDGADTVDLIAEQHIDVGGINITNDEDNLYISFYTTEDWYMTETHLAVSTLVDGIPQKKGNPIPGHFPYKAEYEPPIQEQDESYVIPIEGEWFKSGVCIAVHAAVQQIVDENIMQEESAWGAGIDFTGKNWATYFTYTIAPTQEPLTVTHVEPPDDAVDISVYDTPDIYFSADLNLDTITNNSILLMDSSNTIVPVDLDKAYRGVTLRTFAPLTPGATYTIHATKAVQNIIGNSLVSEFISTFTTALPQGSLTVTHVEPPDDAVDISVYDTPDIYFSADLNLDTITNNSILLWDSSNNKVPVGFGYNVRAVTLEPLTLLTTDTTYTVRATPAVKDVGGNPLESEFTSTFTTALN